MVQTADAIEAREAREATAAELFEALEASPEGLSEDEARARLERYGPNALEEKAESTLRKFLGYFWGPIPWMIEAAALLSAVVRNWADLGIILVLLAFNAGVGFWQEHQAANAVAALKRKLALKARVRRAGAWREASARELVPGDVIRLRLGDIVPADVKLVEGEYLSVDQSALTGESLPVDKQAGDTAYSGSVARQGEMVALVTATGAGTYFGKTARLVARAGAASHFQKAVLAIGDYLIYLSLGLVAAIVLAQILRGAPLLELAQFALILVVASIPVALPAVLSVTMAMGALALSKLKAIVTRLESIEEMAGMDVLCADKTGTLTQNRLTLGESLIVAAEDADDLVAAAALASRREDDDAIDRAVLGGLHDESRLEGCRQRRFVPFDPVHKRTEAEIAGPDGTAFRVSKGAPQVILDMAHPSGAERAKVEQAVDDLAARGYRTLGVARAADGGEWRFLGLLSLYDPPREDAKDTIAHAREHGIEVKMVTGDNRAIAREIAGELGLGRNIRRAGEILETADGKHPAGTELAADVQESDGFSEVFPEHKYRIVKAFQAGGHIVGMTGDGVNDAPALKQADVGVAVSGATDAARAAADLVLTAPGLDVIVNAIEEARRIFERMNSYAIYRIAETIRVVVFIALAMLVYDFYPITAVMIILLALLNDIPIMTIAFDNTWLDPKPVRWQMHRVLTVSTVLGVVGVIETFLLLVVAESWLGLEGPQLQSVIFLKLIVAGHLTLFVARMRKPFFTRPYPAPVLLAAVLGTQTLGVLIVHFGWLMAPIPWRYIGGIWGYALTWILIEDLAKCLVYRHLEQTTARHRGYIDLAQQALHPHGGPRGKRH
jgi:H+-transporting ATPase